MKNLEFPKGLAREIGQYMRYAGKVKFSLIGNQYYFFMGEEVYGYVEEFVENMGEIYVEDLGCIHLQELREEDILEEDIEREI